MVRKKTKSKRQSLKLKYDIQKKVKEHKRKLRKFARQNPHLRQKVKKDPGIPNLWPFKSQMLDALARKQEKMSDEQERQKKARQKAQEKRRRELVENKMNLDNNNIDNNIDNDMLTRDDRGNITDGNRRKWFMKELKQVLDEADVILEVLDARDPLGCRCTNLEKQLLGYYSQKAGKPKRIILVLNKIDLIPADIATRWIKYLRREFPVIAFKASTENKRRITHQRVSATQATDTDVNRKGCIGAQALIQLLKKFSMNNKGIGALTVGVVGYPNVGKSSIINSLKRSKAVGVGAVPGYTTKVTTVRLDKNIQLLDSPGVLVSSGSVLVSSGTTDSEADLVLRNCLRVDSVQDVIGAAHAIVERCHPAALLQTYQISQFQTPDQFLFLVARKRGKLRKGGVPDLEAGARSVLQDWNDGRIPYYTVPPTVNDVSSAQIVDDWTTELNVQDLINQNNTQVTSDATSTKPSNMFMQLDSSTSMDINMDIDEQNNNNDDEDEMNVNISKQEKKFEVDMSAINNNNDMNSDDDNDDDDDDDDKTLKASDLVTQKNTTIKKEWKKQKKNQQKQARRAKQQKMDELDDNMVDDNEDYVFARDY